MVELTYEEYETITNAILNLEQAIQRVHELHSPLQDRWIDGFRWCAMCEVEYPCPTIKALEGEQ